MKKSARQANFELLRILAMLMVVILHYLNRGQIAVSLDETSEGVHLLACFLKALCIVAVNSYVLISGYFLTEAQWKISHLMKLIFQIWLYSVSVPLVCLVFGIGGVKEWSVYDWANVIFPLQMEHYWFATAYAVMYILVPVLGGAVKKMSKQQLQTVIGLLLIFFSLAKSVIPILIPTDKYGYDFGWFICVFLIAAYIRRYGMPVLTNKRRAFGVYFALVGILWLANVVLGFLTRKGLPLWYALDMTFSYNHILVLAASVALFCGFSYVRIPWKGLSKLICRIAPYTFGVYLLHENIAVRELWPYWFQVEKVQGSLAFVPHMAGCVLAVFLAGIMIDFIRDCLMKVLTRAVSNKNAGKPEK